MVTQAYSFNTFGWRELRNLNFPSKDSACCGEVASFFMGTWPLFQYVGSEFENQFNLGNRATGIITIGVVAHHFWIFFFFFFFLHRLINTLGNCPHILSLDSNISIVLCNPGTLDCHIDHVVIMCCAVLSCSVMSNSLQCHGL